MRYWMQSSVESFNGKSDKKYIELSKNVIKLSQFLKNNNFNLYTHLTLTLSQKSFELQCVCWWQDPYSICYDSIACDDMSY